MTFKTLKEEAANLGIVFSPNIGEETLKTKIREFKLAQEVIAETTGAVTKVEQDNALRDEALKLVRVKVTCLNVEKARQQGFWAIGSNSLVGTIKKFIPVNVPWYMPQILVNVIQEKQFTISTGKNNQRMWTKEYNVEILPDISIQELEDLKHQQALKATSDQ